MVKVNEVKAALVRCGMTQRELAEKLGIDAATLNRKINSEDGKAISVYEALRMVDVLGIPRSKASDIFFA